MSDPLNVVIVGAVACGAKAASRIRRLDPKANITMIDQGQYISYAGCGLPYYVSGQVKEFEDLIRTPAGATRDVNFFKGLKNIDTRTGTRVESIDRAAKTVVARDLASGAEETISYDKLVLATGAAPTKPAVEGLDLEGVHHLTTMEDAAAVAEAIAAKPRGDAVVIGAGFIGVEATEALAERGWMVTLLEREDQLFPGALDFEIAAVVQEHMFERAVEVEVSANLRRVEGEDGHVAKVVTDEDEYDADLVIVAAGVKPNIELAREAGLDIGETGALAVNEHLQTSDPDIYAGGDLVENVNLVSGKKCFVPLGSTANKHGRVIADNICGVATEFPGIQGTFVCKAFGVNVGATGLTEAAARELGLEIYVALAPAFDKAHYYPGSAMIGVKLVVERGTDRVLGLQAVGAGDAARRVDVAATAIRFGAKVNDLADLDLAYAPPYAQAMDALITAANVARNERDGIMKSVSPMDARKMLDERDDVILLDVRGADEFKNIHIDHPKVVNIPMGELRARQDELPRDGMILSYCAMGLRGFSGQRMLNAMGFDNVATVAGGGYMWPWKDDMV